MKLPDLKPMTIRKFLKEDLENSKIDDWESIKPDFTRYKKSTSRRRKDMQKSHYGFSPFPPQSPREAKIFEKSGFNTDRKR